MVIKILDPSSSFDRLSMGIDHLSEIGCFKNPLWQNKGMKTHVVLDPEIVEPEVTLKTRAMSPEVERLLAFLDFPLILTARSKNNELVLLRPEEIFRIWCEDKKVLAKSASQTFVLQSSLASLEGQLKEFHFLRISNGELINLRAVRSFDLSMAGTILVTLKNGEMTYVSRRRVREIKKRLKEGRL